MELWDIYDINRNKLKKTIDRHSNQMLNEGEYHLVVEAIIINSKKQILIGQRAKFKKKYPLLWECNGGAVKSGENSKQGIIRELNEELGIQFKDNEAIYYKEIRDDDSKTFKDIWIFYKDIDINQISFKDNEVIDVMWVTIDELENMRKKSIISPKLELNKEEFKDILKIIV